MVIGVLNCCQINVVQLILLGHYSNKIKMCILIMKKMSPKFEPLEDVETIRRKGMVDISKDKITIASPISNQ